MVLASVEQMDRDCARMAVLVVVSRPKDDAREEQGGDTLAEDLEQRTVGKRRRHIVTAAR